MGTRKKTAKMHENNVAAVYVGVSLSVNIPTLFFCSQIMSEFFLVRRFYWSVSTKKLMHAVKSKKANKKVKQGHCSYNMTISFFNYAETINFLLRQKTPTFSYN